jgi:hypothetical protein
VLQRVRDEVSAADSRNPLTVATDVLYDIAGIQEGRLPAWGVYVHLVYFQQVNLLPGYPLLTAPHQTPLPTLQEFCTDSERISGQITDENIRSSAEIKRERVYRSKVLSTTSDCQLDLLKRPTVRYEWDTSVVSRSSDIRYQPTSIYADGTSHNVLTALARDWVTQHAAIDWATAPHEVGTGGSRTEADAELRSLTNNPPTEKPEHTTYTFDIAGFAAGSPPTMQVIGRVLTDYTKLQLYLEIGAMYAMDAVGLLVVKSRDMLYAVVEALLSLFHDLPKADKIVEQCEKLPNIRAINKYLNEHILAFNPVYFTTAKQLVDDIVTPTDVFGSRLSDSDA